MHKKRFITIIGTLIHLLLGTVYARSYFQTPIIELSGWSNSAVTWTFSISIFMLGITAAWAGNKISLYGSRKLTIIGGLLYGIGYIISGYALIKHNLPLLYLGFGLLGGMGLGLAYVTPVTTVSSWFPKKQGLATGMVVMGFGFGALIMSKILAPLFLKLTNTNIAITFIYTGILMAIVIPLLALFLNPPIKEHTPKQIISINFAILKQYFFSKPFIIVWLIFMINVVAGMIFISFQAPLFQDLLKAHFIEINSHRTLAKITTLSATLIAISSLFNGIGRLLWGGITDKIGQIETLRILLIIQAIVFGILIFVKNPIIFAIGVCVILLSYGGGFGVIPSLAKRMYGQNMMSSIYGGLLTAWGIGGILGPQIVAIIKDVYPNNVGTYAFSISSLLLIGGIIISFGYTNSLSKKTLNHSLNH